MRLMTLEILKFVIGDIKKELLAFLHKGDITNSVELLLQELSRALKYPRALMCNFKSNGKRCDFRLLTGNPNSIEIIKDQNQKLYYLLEDETIVSEEGYYWKPDLLDFEMKPLGIPDGTIGVAELAIISKISDNP